MISSTAPRQSATRLEQRHQRLPVAAQHARQLVDALDAFPFRIFDVIASLDGGSPSLFGFKVGPILPESVPEPPLSTFNYAWGMLRLGGKLQSLFPSILRARLGVLSAASVRAAQRFDSILPFDECGSSYRLRATPGRCQIPP